MGYVKLSPTLKKEGHIAIIVAAQGYLDDFRQLAWKARYEDEWRRDPRQAERFLVVIPTETIENAHIFNPSLDDESATVRL
jgi:hypothetical protein